LSEEEVTTSLLQAARTNFSEEIQSSRDLADHNQAQLAGGQCPLLATTLLQQVKESELRCPFAVEEKRFLSANANISH